MQMWVALTMAAGLAVQIGASIWAWKDGERDEMSRLATMARFAPPDDEPKVIDTCACGCGEEILEGYQHFLMDGDWFYDEDCLMKYLGAERRVAG